MASLTRSWSGEPLAKQGEEGRTLAAAPVVRRCALCPWEAVGDTLHDTRAAFEEHRSTHPEPVKRKRRSTRTLMGSTGTLERNVARARAAGAKVDYQAIDETDA